MSDIDWTQFASTALITMVAIYYGRWSQRRDDRRKARRGA